MPIARGASKINDHTFSFVLLPRSVGNNRANEGQSFPLPYVGPIIH